VIASSVDQDTELAAALERKELQLQLAEARRDAQKWRLLAVKASSGNEDADALRESRNEACTKQIQHSRVAHVPLWHAPLSCSPVMPLLRHVPQHPGVQAAALKAEVQVHACLEAKASAALHAAKQELQDVREHFEAQMRHLDRDHKGEVAGLMQEIGSLRAATAQGIRGQRRGVTERPAASQQRQTQGEMQKAMKDSHACRWNRWQVAAQNTG